MIGIKVPQPDPEDYLPHSGADCDRPRSRELVVINRDGEHKLVFPCRRILGGWMNAETRVRIEVYPTH